MTYIAQTIEHLYANPLKSEEDEVAEWLNQQEAQGYRLVAVLPDHQTYDENMEPEGNTSGMLIMHKEDRRGMSGILAES